MLQDLCFITENLQKKKNALFQVVTASLFLTVCYHIASYKQDFLT